MKNYILLSLLFLFTNLFAQFEEPLIIDNTLEISVRNLLTIDIDNDDLKDILVSSYFNDIFWYKNNGMGFDAAQNISIQVPVPYHLDKADVNADGFIDILVTNNNGNNSGSFVFLNNNGGESWTEVELDNTLELGAFKSFFIDVDKDGDMDVVSNGDTKIAMYTNDGQGSFSSAITIESMDEYYSMTVGDFTADNFDDLMVNSANSGTILFTNNTNGSFDTPITIENGLSIFLSSADIDNDNDLDLFRGNPNSAFGIQCLINNASNFNFSFNEPELNPLDVTVSQFHLSDINSNNFKDLLYINNDEILWKANQQDGTFENPIMIDNSFSYKNVFSDDIDNDGDNDIIWYGWDSSSSTEIHNLGIIKNNTTLGIHQKTNANAINISPNPSSSLIHISTEHESDFKDIQIFNVLGQMILSTEQTTIDISNLDNGHYFLKLHSPNTKSINSHFIKN